MTYTGIIRRVDDLGRVVIPLEIRRSLRIHEGDPLEISVIDDSIILNKHSELNSISSFAESLCKSLYSITGNMVAIVDRYSVLASCGTEENLKGCKFYNDLYELQSAWKNYCCADENFKISLFDGHSEYFADVIIHIMTEAELVGSVIFFYNADKLRSETENHTESDYNNLKNFAKHAATFISLNLTM